MARNVGSIEVTVDANTRRLKAQITAASREAAAIANRNLEEIEVPEERLKIQFARLRASAERAFSGIAVDFDVQDERLRRDLEGVAATLRNIQLAVVLDPELNETGLAEAVETARLATRDIKALINPETDRAEWLAAVAELQAFLDAAQFSASVGGEVDEASLAQARARLEAILAKALKVKVNADMADLVADLEEIRAAEEADAIKLDIELRTALALAEGDAVRKEISDLEAEMKLDLDTRQAILKALGFKKEVEAERVAVEAELETLRAQIAFDAFILRNEAQKLHLDMELDLGAEQAKMVAFRRELAGQNFLGQMGDAGEKAGESFSKGFGGGGTKFLPHEVTEWIPLIIASLEPAAVAIQGLLGPAVEVVASGFAAIGAAAGAAAPLVAGLAASLGAVLIGSINVVDGMKAVSKEFTSASKAGREFNINAEDIQNLLEEMAPAAQRFVVAFAEILPQFKQFQRLIADRLFEGLDDQLRLLSQETIPDIGHALANAATSANRFFEQLGAAAQDIDFSNIVLAIQPALDALGRAIANVVRTLDPFLKAAAPAAAELASMFLRASDALLRMVQAGQQSGALQRFLEEGLDSLKLWGELLAEVTESLILLFRAGKAGGDGLISSLSDIVSQFNDWMRSIEGQQALKEFFDGGREALSALTPLLKGAAGFFKNLITPDAIDRFRDLAESIGAVLPVLAKLVEAASGMQILQVAARALAGIADAIEPVIPLFEELTEAIGRGFQRQLDILLGILPDVADLIAALLEAFTPVAVDLIDATVDLFATLAPFVAAAARALAIFVRAIAPLLDIISPLVTGFTKLTGAVVAFIEAIQGVPFLGTILKAVLGVDLKASLDAVNSSFETVERSGGLWANTMDSIITAAQGSTAVITETKASYADYSNQINDVIDVLDGYSEAELAAAEAARVNQAQTERNVKWVKALDDELKPLLEDMNKLRAVKSLSPIERGLLDAAKAAGKAADEADRFNEAIEKLVSPARDVDEAWDDLRDTFDENLERIESIRKGEEGFVKTVDGLTKAGRENKDMLREQADATLALTGLQLAHGESTEQITADYVHNRQALHDMAMGMGATEEEADTLVNTMLGFPDTVETLIKVPGLLENMGNVVEYDADLDGIPNSVDSEFSAPNLDLVREQARLYGIDLTNVPDDVLTTFLAEHLRELNEGVSTLETGMAAVDGDSATVQFDSNGNVVNAEVDALQANVADPLFPTPITFQSNAPEIEGQIGEVVSAAATLSVTTANVQVTTNAPEVEGQIGAVTSMLGALGTTVVNPVIGVDDDQAHQGIADTSNELTELDAVIASPGITLPTYPDTKNKLDTTGRLLGGLDNFSADPTITLPTYNATRNQLSNLQGALDLFDASSATATISLNGASAAQNSLNALAGQIRALDGSTIDIFVRERGVQVLGDGGVAKPGYLNIAGEAGPERLRFRGGAEAMINSPMVVPPGTVVTPINSMPGAGTLSLPVSRQVNNYMTFNLNSGDARAIAAQVVNRSAVLANG